MAASMVGGKRELVIAVIVVAIGLWYVWPSSEDPQSTTSEAPAKAPTVAATAQTNPVEAKAVPAQRKQSPASALKEDQDILDEYYHIAHAAQGDNPDGSDCANQGAAYQINYQGAQGAHDAFVKDPQQAVSSQNDFARSHPSLHIPLLTVEDSPAEMLKADKATLTDAEKWLEKHGCRT